MTTSIVVSDGGRRAIIPQTGDFTVTIPQGYDTEYLISKGTAAAITIPPPTSGTDDGKIIRFTSQTAAAHVITCSDGFNAKGSTGTLTFAATIGKQAQLRAFDGHWYSQDGTIA